MTLEELKALVANKATHAAMADRAESQRRNIVIIEQLAQWGLTTEDGWTIETRPDWGVSISHPPELPTPVGLLLSGDGKGRLLVEHRTCDLNSAENLYALLVDLNS